MKKFQLNAEPRTELGKKAVKAIRKEGKIPAVINGGELVELPYNRNSSRSTPSAVSSPPTSW